MPKWIQVGDQRLNLDAIWALKWGTDCLEVYLPGVPTPQRFEGELAQRIWDYARAEVWEQPKLKKPGGKNKVNDPSHWAHE
jgi:hypothetical protein